MSKRNRKTLWIIVIFTALILLPFIPLTEFYSKGEPREAVVALSMLNQNNWILPVNNGCDLAYKPPFFHWLIALFSLPFGSVNEFTSRLPSALALVALVASTFIFISKRRGQYTAAVTSLLLLSAFEVMRAGMACRVDMLLTLFIVAALYFLYDWYDNGMKGISAYAVIMMSCATLTKGPIGIILPTLAIVVFMLIRRVTVSDIIRKTWPIVILPCILPLLWYAWAFIEGGDRFMDLVFEENVGRFLGKMSYDSHVHPFTYNFMTLLSGWLPWTVMVVASLFIVNYKSMKERIGNALCNMRKGSDGKRQCPLKAFTADGDNSFRTFLWTAFLTILIFYCIPSSKRSTYLLPCYPFMAALLAELMAWLTNNKPRVIKSFCIFMAALSFIITAAFVATRAGAVPESLFHGKHADANIMMLRTISSDEIGIIGYLMAFLPSVAGVAALLLLYGRKAGKASPVMISLALVFSLYITLNGFFLPRLLNTKSSKPFAELLMKTFKKGTVYQYVSSPMLHFFGTDFYMNDEMPVLTPDKNIESGILVVAETDTLDAFRTFNAYNFKKVYTTPHATTVLNRRIAVFKFTMKPVRRRSVGTYDDTITLDEEDGAGFRSPNDSSVVYDKASDKGNETTHKHAMPV